MIYKVDKIENENKVKITVKFTKEEFEKALSKHPSDVRQTALNAAMNELITKSYEEIVREEKIEVAGFPSIALSEEVSDKYPFAYSAEVEVSPTIELIKYEGLNVKEEVAEVSEQEVNSEINNMLASTATLNNVEGPLQNGHVAIIDFVGTLDGVAFEGGTGRNYSLEIGSHTFVPGFEEQMVGMKVNEVRNINITFPENYVEHLAGKAVVFEVTVHEIKEKVLPTLDDAFAKSLAIENVSTVGEYRQYLYNQILEYKTAKAKEQTAMKVSIALMQANPMKIPAALIEQYINNQLARISKQAEAYQMPLEVLLKYSGFNSVEEFKKRYSLIARDHLHEQYILRAVIMKEKISVTKEELDAHYELIASSNKTTVEEIKKRYSEEAILESALMEKGRQFIIEKNVIK